MSDEPTISPDDLRDAPEGPAPVRAFRLRAVSALWRPFRGPWGMARLAAAAVVLIAVGAWSYHVIHERHERAEREEHVEANRPLLTITATLHETAGWVPRGDYADAELGAATVARQLSSRL